MNRQLEMRGNLIRLTHQIQKTRNCGYVTKPRFELPKKKPPSPTQMAAGIEKSKLQSGARIPTATRCLWGQNSLKLRNECQVAHTKYYVSMATLEQSARELYKCAKLRSKISEQGKARIKNQRDSDHRNIDRADSSSIEEDSRKLSQQSERLHKLFLLDDESAEMSVGNEYDNDNDNEQHNDDYNDNYIGDNANFIKFKKLNAVNQQNSSAEKQLRTN
ncbi:uncharacterized protein LOC108606900 [Drosophila busckii]|uniref:uncharacterized protein LOC108606900 n=1 Tax=Drosophila busckii TaxID=30019 RepID=UPI00083EFE8C|nr:uncharacterized protein LOC108606900 [Drosophila busckii]